MDPILENHPLGLAHISGRRFVWANARWAEILGLIPEHLAGADVASYHLTQGSFAVFSREVLSVLARGGRFQRDVRLRRVDGTPFWGHLCGSLRVPGQRAAGSVWSLEDVTERVEAQAEQGEALVLNEKLIAASASGILLYRAVDGRCIKANDAAGRMLSTAAEDLLDRSFRRMEAWKAAGMLAAAEAALATGQDQRLETWLAASDGLRIWVDAQFVPFVSGGERLLLLMLADISARIQASLELQKTEGDREALMVELKQKNKELETLVYVASHDLRSPLVNIQGFSQRLGKALDEVQRSLETSGSLAEVRSQLAPLLEQRMPAALGYIRASGARMDAIINGLLRLSRAGRMVLRTESLDMDQLLQSAGASMAFQFQSAGGVLRVEPLPDCLGDPVQIAQVFSNLLDNAIKYRDPARPLKVRISGQAQGRVSCYQVEDNGLGIPEDQRDRVWDIFQRLDPSGPTPGEGLGLTLVRRMVERNGGQIWMEPARDHGCRFQVELPAG